jgi:cell division protein FtsA
MNKNSFQTIFDCGSSKVRAGIFNKNNKKEAFYAESEFFIDQSNLELKIQKIITSFEKDTNEYIDNINLMVDSSKMFSIGISIYKKFDGSRLRKENIQFLIQEAKQQILKYYTDYNIAHIIINNYKIDDVDYYYLPDEIKCHFISLDILFICLPSSLVVNLKNTFSKSNISINQIICSSYAKAINYKDNFSLFKNISFIDVGFNKTSIITYFNNKIISLNILPIGGDHITKDISKLLKIDLEQAEKLKINFEKNKTFLSYKDFSLEFLEKIICARTEEILEKCLAFIKLNSTIVDRHKMILMGDGSKILDSYFKDKIIFINDIDFLEETKEDVCQSGFKLGMGLNKQEVLVKPKKQINQGFFEKLFHFFK